MKFKDMNYSLSINVVKTFYKLVLAKFNSKDEEVKLIKENKKKIEKYQDTSYLLELFNNKNISTKIKEILNEEVVSKNIDFRKNIEVLQGFYSENMENKEILDPEKIKKDVNIIDKNLVSSLNNINVRSVSGIYDFSINILNEMSFYEMKHKNEEYMDMRLFNNKILDHINVATNLINELQDDYSKSVDELYEAYKAHLIESYNVIFERKGNRKFQIPSWGKGLLFCLPWIIGFGVFTLYPLIQTFIFSFSQVNLTTQGFETSFIGFENYINIFSSDTDFITAIWDYIIEMIIYVPIITVVSLIIALLLNTRIKGRGFFRTIFFLPVIITSGPVMKILIEQGVTSMPGLSNIIDLEAIKADLPSFVATALDILTNEFIMILWFCGIQILVFITGLQKIDKGVYEAANIDGASRWESFWKVTLPAINPTIVINVVFTIVMQSIFALNPIILKIQSDMNDTSAGRGYGYASAIAFTYFVIMILVLVIFVLIFKKKEKRVKKARF